MNYTYFNDTFDLPASVLNDIDNMDFSNCNSNNHDRNNNNKYINNINNIDNHNNNNIQNNYGSRLINYTYFNDNDTAPTDIKNNNKNSNNGRVDDVSKSYQYFVDQNMKLQQENHRYGITVSQLQSEISQLQSKCQQKDATIHSLQNQLLQQQQTFDSKFNDFLHCANDYDQKKTKEISSLKLKVNNITTTLSTIYKKYDNLKQEYMKLHQIYLGIKHENKYKAWKWSNVYEWIINEINDERLNKYDQILFNNLKREDITGSILPNLNEDDFYQLGIKNFYDRELLIAYIQKLGAHHASINNKDNSSTMDSEVDDKTTTTTTDITTNTSLLSIDTNNIDQKIPECTFMPSPRSTLSAVELNYNIQSTKACTTPSTPGDKHKNFKMECNNYLNNLQENNNMQQAANQIAISQQGAIQPQIQQNHHTLKLQDNSVSNGSGAGSIISGITTPEHHKQYTVEQLKKIRIRQKNIVYVVGLPVNLCNAKLLKSSKWFGKYGTISRICFNTSPKCVKANSIPTFVTYTSEYDALQAIQKMNLYCLSDGTRLKTNFGRTKYCPTFCQGKQCINNKCKFLHEWASPDDIITEQEINDFNAIRAGPPSRFNKK